MKTTIGIFPSIRKDGTFALYERYTDAIIASGALPIVIPHVTEADADTLYALMDKCDGFLFTGGNDIDPALYGMKKWDTCGETTAKRDTFELLAFKYAMASGKSILGICRGCQLINVALGGTLIQDIPTAHKSAIRHTSDSVENPTYHEIDIPDNSPLLKLSVAPRVKINSFHHQCVDKLGEGLKILAVSSVDGIPEGVYLDGDRYLVGVQWHPERSYTTESLDKNVFKSFVEAAEKRR
jgi:putative glutamine amidotransferase